MNNEHENANPLSASGGEGQGEVAAHSQLSTENSQLVYAYTRLQAIADGLQAILAGREHPNVVNPEALPAFFAARG